MSCVQYKDRLSLLILDELDDTAAAEVKLHLDGCEQCQKEYDELKEVIKIIEPDNKVTLTPEEKADILINLNRSFANTETSATSNPYSILLKVAAAIIIFTLGFYTNSLINPAPKDITQFEKQTLAANMNQTSFKNYRLSSAGFKLIAKGKVGLDSTNTN